MESYFESIRLPPNFYRKQRYIRENLGATAIGTTIRPRSGQLSNTDFNIESFKTHALRNIAVAPVDPDVQEMWTGYR